MTPRRRHAIRHETSYRHAITPAEVVQLVRLTPTDGPGQRVIHWKIHDVDGRSPAVFVDGFGNRCHLFRRPPEAADAPIVVEGEVETFEWSQGPDRGLPDERLPPGFFLRTTPLTRATPDLRAFLDAILVPGEARARSHRRIEAPEAGHSELVDLTASIRDRIAHRRGVTSVETSAAEALSLGAGVCQDRTHVLLALARMRGHPARYVSGYCEGAASGAPGDMHAWAEVWTSASGWIGLDPSSGDRVTTAHVRVAVGLDYASAAPIRGVRRGGAGESLAVSVCIGDPETVHLQQ